MILTALLAPNGQGASTWLRMSYPSRFGILARKGRQIFVVPAKAGTQSLPPCSGQGQALA